jgi:hypothetical protein
VLNQVNAIRTTRVILSDGNTHLFCMMTLLILWSFTRLVS